MRRAKCGEYVVVMANGIKEWREVVMPMPKAGGYMVLEWVFRPKKMVSHFEVDRFVKDEDVLDVLEWNGERWVSAK